MPKCKTAFHVTCAFQRNLDMKANFDAETELVMKVLVSYVLQVAVCVELRLQLKTDIVLQCCSEICNLMRNIYVHAHL